MAALNMKNMKILVKLVFLDFFLSVIAKDLNSNHDYWCIELFYFNSVFFVFYKQKRVFFYMKVGICIFFDIIANLSKVTM